MKMNKMNKYSGLYTFDTDNHRYVTLAQADGIIDLLNTDDYVPTDPLIKDEKIREVVRVWAEINDLYSVNYKEDSNGAGFDCIKSTDELVRISFASLILPLEKNRVYTIAELCGEEEE